ncbi:hypothetical protein ACFC1R_18945 [Kitasatospora sp. NPDC056138]|uniref:hypothetical protein n=1 Tax=Kitasatospora sp. NPDC056138 TaxID=3345724 RepID=UPI0035D8114C
MIRTRRPAMLTAVLLSSLALGPAVAAHGAAAQAPALAPAKARCLLTQDSANSKPDDPKFTLSASGFKSDSVSFSGGNGGGGAKLSNGSFSINNLGPGRYTVTGDKDGSVSCGSTPGLKNDQKAANSQYKKGFSDGFAAIKANCTAKPPQSLTTVDPNYQMGFTDGAALAAKQFCK